MRLVIVNRSIERNEHVSNCYKKTMSNRLKQTVWILSLHRQAVEKHLGTKWVTLFRRLFLLLWYFHQFQMFGHSCVRTRWENDSFVNRNVGLILSNLFVWHTVSTTTHSWDVETMAWQVRRQNWGLRRFVRSTIFI